MLAAMIIPAFVQRCDSYCARRGIARATLSTLLFDDGKRIDALAGGSNVGVLTLERAGVKLDSLEMELGEREAAA